MQEPMVLGNLIINIKIKSYILFKSIPPIALNQTKKSPISERL